MQTKINRDPMDLDYDALHDYLQAIPGLAPTKDDSGLVTSAYTLSLHDATEPGGSGHLTLDHPDEAADAVKAATTPAKVAAWPVASSVVIADASLADAARVPIVSSNLQAAGVTEEALLARYDELLSKAKAGIPWFEGFVGGKDPTDADLAAALTKFQALPQATKDRALFNCLRTLAAIMRYNTGDI